MEHEIIRAKFRIVGAVQNVGYRHWLRGHCTRNNIRGWARNECDSSVTTLLVGPKEHVDELSGWLRLGPESASVLDATALRLEDEDTDWNGDGFEVLG